MPEHRSDIQTPMVMSATNPLGSARGLGAAGKGPLRTSMANSDLPSDLMYEAGLKSKGAKQASKYPSDKPRIPLPAKGKRTTSLNPARLKTSSAADLGMYKSTGKPSARGETPSAIGSRAGDSTTFSKRTSATGGAKNFDLDPVRPNTEFLPSASLDFSEKVKPGRLRPIRQKSKSGQN